MSLFHGLVRGYRRLAMHVVAPKSCPICLDELPALGLREAKPIEDGEPTFAKLSCKHKFCTSACCYTVYYELLWVSSGSQCNCVCCLRDDSLFEVICQHEGPGKTSG